MPIPKLHVNPKRLRRRILHGMAHAFQTIMTRTTVRGLENIPGDGPLLVLPNHVSNLDGILVLANYPRQMEMVGPGDFKMINLKDLMLRAYGLTLVNRGHADTDGLKSMLAQLKAGNDLLMFPGGGMWEKRTFEAKPGAAYLSQATGARILPVALGGTYLKSNAAFYGEAPDLTITFGKVMPAIPRSQDRRQRDHDLDAASQEIMQRIYDLLEPSERALYDRWARELYEMHIDFADDSGEPVAYTGPALPDMAALAEFIAKPNLFRPMWENAGLALEPFREQRFFGPVDVQIAARQLRENVTGGTFERYLPYRMGDEAAADVVTALDALHDIGEWAINHRARIRLTPVVADPADQNSPAE
jgi:1-acyl-sn-glycerol-3-phosphate acyltransferase